MTDKRAVEAALDQFLMRGPLGDAIDKVNQRLQVLMTECRGNEKAEELISEVAGILRAHYRAAQPPTPSTHDWVKCPVCGEPDMEKVPEGEEFLISCTNTRCASNGGDNVSALSVERELQSAHRVWEKEHDELVILREKLKRLLAGAQPESTPPTPRQVPIHMTETALDFDSEIEYIKELNAKAGPAQEAEKGQGK